MVVAAASSSEFAKGSSEFAKGSSELANGSGEQAKASSGLANGRAVAAAVLDHSGYVRRARRLADLSQRELSALIGIDQSQVARIEAGRAVDVATFARMLAAAGLRLAVVDSDGVEVRPMPADVMRDGGGRRQPAHLDVRAAPDRPSPEMLARHREPEPRISWHHRRTERDRRRGELGIDATHEQPTMRSVAQWRRANEAARRERARPVARRELAELYARIGVPEELWAFSLPDDPPGERTGHHSNEHLHTNPHPHPQPRTGAITGRDGPPATAAP